MLNMEEQIQYRSRYQYLSRSRCQITTNIRKDLRDKYKLFAINIHEPESKIYDQMINYFLSSETNTDILTDLVKNYY